MELVKWRRQEYSTYHTLLNPGTKNDSSSFLNHRELSTFYRLAQAGPVALSVRLYGCTSDKRRERNDVRVYLKFFVKPLNWVRGLKWHQSRQQYVMS